MKRMVKFALLSIWGISFSAVAFELSGSGHGLMADGGISREFVPIMQANHPFTIESLPQTINCQGTLHPTGLAMVGQVVEEGRDLAVFAGMSEVMFSLQWQTGTRGWQGVTSAGIDCVAGEPVRLKVRFYRQHHTSPTSAPTSSTHILNRSFAFRDNQNEFPIHLNATLNFATPPKTYSCKLISAPQQTIRLGQVLASTLEREGRVMGANVANFTLDCNDAKATVLAMVYDNLDNGNFGADKTILSIKSGGATGVGIQLYKDGQALPLGQKSHTYDPHNSTYWQIQGGEQRQLTLGAGYVKTGEVGVGVVEAQAGLVFFYP
ncbi:fimbrial protein [Moraxella oblonga]|uniref:fimbrial protein n=1 Tax=Moraxella oblonga TaxID=200413 RepID=UPI000835F589|nr:fimbrial protein [Moraxella oblonga]